MRRARFLVLGCLAVLLLLACAPETPSASAPQAPAPRAASAPTAVTPLPIAKPAWQEKWERTLAAAKQEATVVLYTSEGGEARQAVTSAFKAKYGIPVEAMTGGTSVLGPKIAAERRAGIYSGDVYIGGSTLYRLLPEGVLDSIEPALILPELTEPELIKKTWLFGELPWADKAHTNLIALMRVGKPIGINTSLVKPGELTAYRDLLDPKWKGKMSLNDPQVSGMGDMWFSVVLEVGDVDVNYIRELVSKQDVFITRDRRLQADWLAKEKRPIAIAMQTAAELEFVRAGAPISRINIGTTFVSGGSGAGIGLISKAAHPNAAKLFVNWLLSQEGQTVHSQALGYQPRRLDVPTTHLDPSDVVKPGFKAFSADDEGYNAKRSTTYAQLAKEVFGPFTR